MSTSEEQLGDVTEMSFGARLRAERESREISLHDVAQQLNLHPRAVEALENEQHDQLPSPAFVRGYLRSYGRLLGMDSDTLVREYNQYHGEDPVPCSMSQRAEQPDSSQPVMRWATVLIIVLLAGLLVAWLLTRNGGNAEAPTTEGAGSQENTSQGFPSQPAAESETLSSEVGGSASSTLVVSTGEPGNDDESLEETDALIESAALEANAAEQGVDQAAGAETQEASAQNSESAAALVAAETEAAPTTEPAVNSEPEPEPVLAAVIAPRIEDNFEAAAEEIAPVPVPVASNGTDILELRAVEDSWAEITDSDGKRLMFDLLRDGEPRRLIGVAPFRVFLGNAPPVELKINGLAVLPARINARNTARFSVNADGSQQ